MPHIQVVKPANHSRSCGSHIKHNTFWGLHIQKSLQSSFANHGIAAWRFRNNVKKKTKTTDYKTNKQMAPDGKSLNSLWASLLKNLKHIRLCQLISPQDEICHLGLSLTWLNCAFKHNPFKLAIDPALEPFWISWSSCRSHWAMQKVTNVSQTPASHCSLFLLCPFLQLCPST